MTVSEFGQLAVNTGPSLVERFAGQLIRHADRPAVETDRFTWTYRQLDAVSNRLAGRIGGSHRDPPVAILMDHDAPLIATILAILKTGRPYVVLDARDTPGRRLQVCEFSQASGVVVDSSHKSAVMPLRSEGKRGIVEFTDGPRTDDFGFATGILHAASHACILFTSGTTGEPKGVIHTHESIGHHIGNYSKLAEIGPDDRISLLTGCHLTASLSSLWAALLNGATLCPFSLRENGVAAITGWAARRRITVMHTVPAVWRSITGVWDGLRLLRLGGETIQPSDVERFQKLTQPPCRMMVSFSSSETGASCMRLFDHTSRVTGTHVPLGLPAAGMHVELRDDQNTAVAPGEVGRIVVRSRFLCVGYWNDREQTADRFRIDPANPAQRVFDTGDLGRWNGEGELEHHGRADSRVKIRGLRVEPGEVEAALLGVEGVTGCAVVGQADSSGQTQLVAYLAGESTALPDDGTIRRRLRSVLQDHMIPAIFVRLDRLPQTTGGKIDRRALPRATTASLESDGSQVSLTRRPRDPIEQQIAKIWQKVLGRGPIHRDDDFFLDLAGTSLEAAAVVTRIEHEMGHRLPLSGLMQHPTVAALAEYLGREVLPESSSPLLLLQRGSGPPLFLMHRGHGGLYGYRQLIAGLSPSQTVYGVQSIGLQGEEWPLGTLEAMGRRYADEIERAEPAGPYLLGGICLGGLVAMETAQQLVARGKAVSLLAMIATTHPGMGGRRTGLRDRLSDGWTHFWRIVRWRMWWTLDRLTARRLRLTSGPKVRRLVTYVNTRARRRYRPRKYPGKIELFIGSYHADPNRVERTLALGRLANGGMRVHELNGNGIELFIPPAVVELATKLQVCIDEANGTQENWT